MYIYIQRFSALCLQHRQFQAFLNKVATAQAMRAERERVQILVSNLFTSIEEIM